MKGKMTRTVKAEECPWLKEDLYAGEFVYMYTRSTYGCITPSGVAVSDVLDKEPFYEVPHDSVEWETEDTTLGGLFPENIYKK